MVSATLVGCHDDPTQPTLTVGCAPSLSIGPTSTPAVLTVLGQGPIVSRYTGEVDARGTTAYTTTWSGLQRTPGVLGNAVFIWDVAGTAPQLVDSIIVPFAVTLGDVAVSDDGSLLVVATELSGGSIVVYDITAPRSPKLLSRFTNSETDPGVHTAEIGRVGGRLYAFLSVDPRGSVHARLVTVDLGDPAHPQQVFSTPLGTPFVHDTFLRDGVLFLAVWNSGMMIMDVGGAGKGTPAAPRIISTLSTVNGSAHNIWWYHDPATGSKAYAFVGEEGPGDIGTSAAGDIHVVDICDMANPQEVAFYHVPGAGTHNFSMDESRGILYAAYYNGGVRALDVRGNLGDCPTSQRATDGRCDLALMGREIANGVASQPNRYVWGVVYRDGFLYASDMINGLWKLKAVGTP
jgi:hypothetical protein